MTGVFVEWPNYVSQPVVLSYKWGTLLLVNSIFVGYFNFLFKLISGQPHVI